MKNQEIAIAIHNGTINGTLTIMPQSTGLVVFAHGSGSSRFSSRNKFVADMLNKSKISTFLFDLLTQKEDQIDQMTRQFRFDITLLANRLILVTEWLKNNPETASFNIGYFGASTGAAAALIAAAQLPNIAAVVSRGGRPDLAGNFLSKVKSPTLLIVGGMDFEVIELNEAAFAQLSCVKKLTIIPHATHLFEERGTLEQAATAAQVWFSHYL